MVLALFDPKLTQHEQRKMARKLRETPRPLVWDLGKPQTPCTDPLNDIRSQMDVFVGPKSWRIFELLGKGSAWLHQPVEEWEQCQDYRDVASFLKDLKVVNDAAERCIKDVTDYRDIAQDSQYREDILLVVNDYRHVIHELIKGEPP